MSKLRDMPILWYLSWHCNIQAISIQIGLKWCLDSAFPITQQTLENTKTTSSELEAQTEIPSERQLYTLISEAVPVDVELRPMAGFKMDLSANPGFRKVFFSAQCDCGTAALISVEVAISKRLSEIKQALPSLISKLEIQAKSFYGMSCDMHKRMRQGARQEQ